MLTGVQVETGVVFPVERAEEVIHRARVIVAEVVAVEASETSKVEDSVERLHR